MTPALDFPHRPGWTRSRGDQFLSLACRLVAWEWALVSVGYVLVSTAVVISWGLNATETHPPISIPRGALGKDPPCHPLPPPPECAQGQPLLSCLSEQQGHLLLGAGRQLTPSPVPSLSSPPCSLDSPDSSPGLFLLLAEGHGHLLAPSPEAPSPLPPEPELQGQGDSGPKQLGFHLFYVTASGKAVFAESIQVKSPAQGWDF